jgi:hypothetical protein
MFNDPYPINRKIYSERVVQLIQQFNKFLFLKLKMKY